MKKILLLGILILSNVGFAAEPPANYPIVRGVIRKIDLASARVSIKHEDIPNLNMPGMTMSFLAQDPQILKDLTVGEQIRFVADEVEGELTVLWIGKAAPPEIGVSDVLCTGVAPTSPKTNVEIEIRSDKFSTIRYEYAEGPWKGTAQVNSIGRMQLRKLDGVYTYSGGTGKLDSKLQFKVKNSEILAPMFTNFSAGMENSLVECSFVN